MKERIFRFKKFSVTHSKSAMKVGVDGVLIGAWASCEGKRLLDVGCGCGLIALMLAQRNPECLVEAIDVDAPSVEEAQANVEASPWRERVTVKERSFDDLAAAQLSERYDGIVSNPPFFDAGVEEPLTARERSRHQGALSPSVLVSTASRLLKEGGRLAVIGPADMAKPLMEVARKSGLITSRICYVRNNPRAVEKRVMMEFINIGRVEGIPAESEEPTVTHLTMFEKPDVPTAEYLSLCRDFYLKF